MGQQFINPRLQSGERASPRISPPSPLAFGERRGGEEHEGISYPRLKSGVNKLLSHVHRPTILGHSCSPFFWFLIGKSDRKVSTFFMLPPLVSFSLNTVLFSFFFVNNNLTFDRKCRGMVQFSSCFSRSFLFQN
jgi:hypothetical protein